MVWLALALAVVFVAFSPLVGARSTPSVPLDGHVDVSEMVFLPGGSFAMGTDAEDARDGEAPARRARVNEFYIDKYAVSNAEMREFVRATQHKTDAERFQWDFVFHAFVSEELRATVKETLPGAEWWLPVPRAHWRMPFGRGSGIKRRMSHPAVHISWNDARAFCRWAGKRLPTENEWEYAVRGGLSGAVYPWGNAPSGADHPRLNTWQGHFPDENSLEDGFHGTAPVDSYEEQNAYGVFNMLGNAWEWVADTFEDPLAAARAARAGRPAEAQKVLRGGSYLDSLDGATNHRVRVTTRMGNTPDSSSDNVSFRCAYAPKRKRKRGGKKKRKQPREDL